MEIIIKCSDDCRGSKNVYGEPIKELVRCKDCKEWDEENHWCSIRDSYGWDYKPNDYCSYGVRKAGR